MKKAEDYQYAEDAWGAAPPRTPGSSLLRALKESEERELAALAAWRAVVDAQHRYRETLRDLEWSHAELRAVLGHASGWATAGMAASEEEVTA